MLSVGVDVGGTKILAVALDPGAPGTVIAEARAATPLGAEALLDAIEAVAGDVEATAGRPDGFGVGIPGLVDRTGTLRFAPHLPGVLDLPLATSLAARLGAPVRAVNDADCAAWAEHLAGAALGYPDAVVVTLGTGIGAGIVSGGVLVAGANGFAGEPGHMVVDANGPPCACGRRGCWEVFASGTGLGRMARDAAHAGRAPRALELAGGDAESVRGEHVVAAAREGDRAALDVIEGFAWWVAVGLANLANILDPSILVLGGGVVGAADLLLTPTRAAFARLVMAPHHRPEVRIVAAELGDRAGAIGAALLAQPA